MSTLVQKPAPAFKAPAVMPDNSIRQDYTLEESQGKYRAILFYPYDFSFICPTELLALHDQLGEFKDRDCEVMAISVDSHFSHLAWKRTPVDSGGIGKVGFTLVSDLTREISRGYGVLSDESAALRGTFILDRSGTVRHQSINDMELGRNIQEILRTLDGVRHFDETGETCPANWDGSKKGGEPPAGLAKRLQSFDLR
ncbi:peroxiredoxin [Gemmatimonadota bacterium]